MSRQQEVQDQQPKKAEEVTKKSSVYELPSLPVEFPPKDDGESFKEEQPERTVTFEIQVKNNEDEPHTAIVRSISADSSFRGSAALKRQQLRRRSKSVIKIRQVPTYYLAGVESSELQNKRKAFASKKPSAESNSSITAPDAEPGGVPRGDRRGSFFQSLEQQLAEQQLALNRRCSMSPQNSRNEKMYVSPFVQMLSKLRQAKNLCMRLQEECNSEDGRGADISINSNDGWNLTLQEKLEGLSVEIEENLDWSIDMLQTMNSKKTAGQMAQEQFQTYLKQQSEQLGNTLGNQLAFWVAKTSADKDSMVDTAVLMEPPSSGKLLKTASFSDEGALFGVPMTNEHEIIGFFNDNIDEWGMDVFHLNDITNGHPLVATACAIFRKRDLWKSCKLHKTKFIRYMSEIESLYHNSNPYHNCMHGADVMQSVHTLLNLATFEGSFMPLEIISLLVAAAVHDVDHPGKTNDFLVATNNELAILYHDQSVLESHHLAVAIRTLLKPECNFLSALDASQFDAFKSIVIDMVLATDMAAHYEHVGNMKSMIESKMATSKEIVLDAYNDRVEVMKYMMHCADISNSSKSLDLCKKWTYRVMEEFFLQGDEEKRLGLPVSAIMDRETVVISKSQIGFLDFFVYPLFEVLADLVYPCADFILDNLSNTREYWASLQNQTPGLGKTKKAKSKSSHLEGKQ